MYQCVADQGFLDQLYQEMSASRNKADWKVAGVPVTQLQFNAIYMQISKLLKLTEDMTGIKAKWDDVSDVVVVPEGAFALRFVGENTIRYTGWYMNDKKVSGARANQ